jgi:hypothetical protein
MRRSRPCRTAILVLFPCATRPTRRVDHPTETSSYVRRAAPALLLAVVPRHRLVVTIPWTTVTPSTRHEHLYKELTSPPRALPRHRAAIATVSGAHGELHPPTACTANVCCTACPRIPSSSPGCLLLRPSCQLTGVRAPAAAAGQPSSSLCLRLLSKPMGTCSTSPRSH